MAKEKEILEYKLDISDVEAKAQRIKTLTEEISAKRGRGEDTSALEANLNKETDAVGRLGREEKKTASATEDMVRQKDKLSNVVQVLGGRFGGLIGQLGGVAELLMRGGKAAAVLAAALAALTGGIAIVQRLRNALKQAREEQEKLNQAVTEGKLGRMDVQQQMDIELGRYGLRTAAGSQAAYMMMARLMKQYGLTQGEAAGVAPLATAAGLGTEQAGLLLQLQQMDKGIQVESPAQARHALARIQAKSPEVYAEAQRRLTGIAGTPAGMLEQGKGERLIGKRPVLTADERAYEVRRQVDGMPADIRQAMEKLKEARELREEMRARGEKIAYEWRGRLIKQIPELERKVAGWGMDADTIERERQREAGGLAPPGEGSPTTQPAGVMSDAALGERIAVTIHETNVALQASTVYNTTPNKKKVTSNHGVHSPSEAARWRLPR